MYIHLLLSASIITNCPMVHQILVRKARKHTHNINNITLKAFAFQQIELKTKDRHVKTCTNRFKYTVLKDMNDKNTLFLNNNLKMCRVFV